MMAFQVKTRIFEGPFDLLLHLVSQNQVEVEDLSISEICDQYLEEIQTIETLDLDVASDFLVVASTLLQIKSQTLLPEANNEDEEDQLDLLSAEEARDILVERLIVYKQHRNAAASLRARAEAESHMVSRTVGPDPGFLDIQPDFLQGITLRTLAVICADLASQKQTMLLEANHVAAPRIPLALHLTSVDRQIRSLKKTTFSDLLQENPTSQEVVLTLLSILELYKRNSIEMEQSEVFGPIEIEALEDAPEFNVTDEIDDYSGESGE